MADYLQAAELGLIAPSYADDAAYNWLEGSSAQLLKLLMERGPYPGYFTEPVKSLFITDTPGQEEASKREFAAEGLDLNFVGGSWYLGAYLGPQEDTCIGPRCKGVK